MITSAADRVAASVGDAIVTGDLAPGALITEGEMAQRLSVSRTPVREAFLLLQARGLLRLFPKKGAIVTAIADDETAELLQVRLMLESTAVRARADRGDTGGPLRDDLDWMLAEQAVALDAGDALAFSRADHAFHSRIVAESRNRVIDDFNDQLGPRLARLMHRVAARDTAALDRVLAEHRVLAGHAVTSAADAFRSALDDHLRLNHPGLLS